jgi:hypothetical protein
VTDGALLAPAQGMLRSIYVAITRERAKDLLWGHLKAINYRHQLGMKSNEQELTMTLPEGLGGSIIKLTGADKAKEIEKRRGDKLRRVRVDEAQTFAAYLKPFIEDVLDPALMDLQGDMACSALRVPCAPASSTTSPATRTRPASPGASRVGRSIRGPSSTTRTCRTRGRRSRRRSGPVDGRTITRPTCASGAAGG